MNERITAYQDGVFGLGWIEQDSDNTWIHMYPQRFGRQPICHLFYSLKDAEEFSLRLAGWYEKREQEKGQ